MQLCCLEGIQNLLEIVVQLVKGDAKFGMGVGGARKGGIGVQILEEVGEFGCLIKLLVGAQGNPDELGLLFFYVLKAVFELVELVSVVESHGCAKYDLDKSTHKMFVPYPDLEVYCGSMLAGLQQGLSWVQQILKEDLQTFLEVNGIFFYSLDHSDVLGAGFFIAGKDGFGGL